MNWILPANGKLYDHARAFQKWGFIDWRQNNRKYQVGDIIYIYCTRPYKKIMYKTIFKMSIFYALLHTNVTAHLFNHKKQLLKSSHAIT